MEDEKVVREGRRGKEEGEEGMEEGNRKENTDINSGRLGSKGGLVGGSEVMY